MRSRIANAFCFSFVRTVKVGATGVAVLLSHPVALFAPGLPWGDALAVEANVIDAQADRLGWVRVGWWCVVGVLVEARLPGFLARLVTTTPPSPHFFRS